MSITVRTLQTPTPTDDDRKIGWVDRPILSDVRHDDAAKFTVLDGFLYVWADEDTEPLAVYAPQSWFFAAIDAEASR